VNQQKHEAEEDDWISVQAAEATPITPHIRQLAVERCEAGNWATERVCLSPRVLSSADQSDLIDLSWSND
jgi:hypothetical protein